jgi:multiple antibiotic resistance protein
MIDTLFLAMFVGLFAITAPIADLPLFVAATEGQSGPQRRRTALIATTTYLCACAVALFAGNAALAFFGVSVPGLRLAGMAVVAAIGWKMVAASSAPIAATVPSIPPPCPSPRSVGITPLGFPIYAGPGALSVIIAWGSGPEPVYTSAILAILANAAVILLLNSVAASITRKIGPDGLLVTGKLFGLIIVAVAVDGIASALIQLLPGLRGIGAA